MFWLRLITNKYAQFIANFFNNWINLGWNYHPQLAQLISTKYVFLTIQSTFSSSGPKNADKEQSQSGLKTISLCENYTVMFLLKYFIVSIVFSSLSFIKHNFSTNPIDVIVLFFTKAASHPGPCCCFQQVSSQLFSAHQFSRAEEKSTLLKSNVQFIDRRFPCLSFDLAFAFSFFCRIVHAESVLLSAQPAQHSQ